MRETINTLVLVFIIFALGLFLCPNLESITGRSAPTIDITPYPGLSKLRETIDNYTLPNCEGSMDVSQTIGHSRSVSENAKLGIEVSLRSVASLEAPGISKSEIEARIVQQYSTEYGQQTTDSAEVTIGAKAGTSVIDRPRMYQA